MNNNVNLLCNAAGSGLSRRGGSPVFQRRRHIWFTPATPCSDATTKAQRSGTRNDCVFTNGTSVSSVGDVMHFVLEKETKREAQCDGAGRSVGRSDLLSGQQRRSSRRTPALFEGTSKELVRRMRTQAGEKVGDAVGPTETLQTQEQPKIVSAETTTIETSNTIVETNIPVKEEQTQKLASTAEPFEARELVNRWIPIDTIDVSATSLVGDIIWTCYLPRDLYTKAQTTINMMSFRNYIYGTFDLEFRFVMNCTKFHQGKLLIAAKMDPYKCEAVHLGLNAALARPHVVLDCAANNEASLSIPYMFRRAFTHLIDAVNFGTNAAQYMSLEIYILSPLRTGKGGSATVRLRPMLCMTRSQFTGISHSVNVQMFSLDPFVQRLKNAEKCINYGLKAVAGDKPTEVLAKVVIPRPRLNFMGSKGITDAVPMRSTVIGSTKFYPDHIKNYEPQTIKDLMAIEGLAATFEWQTSDAVDKVIGSFVPDPTYCKTYGIDITPPMLNYIASMFAFWRGTIETRVVVVATGFHTGSLLISTEFDRQGNTIQESASTYTKICDLDEVNVFEFSIPYVYSTIMNRNSGGAHSGTVRSITVTDKTRKEAFNILHILRTKFKITVVNKLVCPESASQSVQVLVFWKAGKDFSVEQLCSTSWRHWKTGLLKSFPLEFDYTPSTVERNFSIEQLNKIKNKVLKTPTTQIIDTEDINKIVDILRRPVLIMQQVTVLIGNEYVLPIMPPSRMMCMYGDLGDTKNSDFQVGLVATPQVAIMNMYRYWRGSNRYSFFFYYTTDPNMPIYITYIPHTGVRQFGQRKWHDDNFSEYFIGVGLLTEIVIPQVNPTITIEVPYGSENTWTLVQEDSPTDNYTWRDKGDLAAGTIVLSCKNQFSFDCWWSAGDDFLTANLYGPPACYNTKGTQFFVDNPTTTSPGPVNIPVANNNIQPHTLTVPNTQTTQTKPVVANAPVVSNTQPSSRASTTSPSRASSNTTSPKTQGTNLHTTTEFSLYDPISPSQNLEFSYGIVKAWYDQWGPKKAIESFISKVKGQDKVKEELVFCRGQLDSILRKIDRRPNPFEPRLNYYGNFPAFWKGIQHYYNVRIQTQAVNYNTQGMDELIQGAAHILKEFALPVSSLAVAGVVSYSATHLKGVSDEIKNTTTKVNAALDTFSPAQLIKERIVGVIVDLLNCLISKDWKSVVVMLGHALTMFVPTVGSYLTEQIQHFITWIKTLITTRTQSFDTSGIHVAAGALGSILGVFLHVSLKSRLGTLAEYLRAIAVEMTSTRFPSYTLQVIRLVTMLGESIKDFIYRLCGYGDARVRALQFLQLESQMFSEFVTRAQEFLDEMNTISLKLPGNRTKYWYTVIQAKRIQSKLALAPHDKVVAPTLGRMCSDVLKKANEICVNMKTCPVRYEPFVVCVEGNPGIGKSYLTQTLISQMFERTKHEFRGVEQIYTKNSGARYWSNFEGNPAVVFDEWLNINSEQCITETLSDLYQLKSTAVFTPPMAELNEKKIKANPMIVLINTNDAFPVNTIQNYVSKKDAVFRRRDVVVNVKLKDQYATLKTVRGVVDREVLEGFDHLTFHVYKDRCDPTQGTEDFESFAEFKEYLLTRWEKWDKEEQVNMQKRMKLMYADLGYRDENGLLDCDPFRIFFGMDDRASEVRQNSYLPSEILEYEVNKFIKVIEEQEKLEEEKRKHTVKIEVKPAQTQAQSTLVSLGSIFLKAKAILMGREICGKLLGKMASHFEEQKYTCIKCGFGCDGSFGCLKKRHMVCSYCLINKPFEMCTEECKEKVVSLMSSEDIECKGTILSAFKLGGISALRKIFAPQPKILHVITVGSIGAMAHSLYIRHYLHKFAPNWNTTTSVAGLSSIVMGVVDARDKNFEEEPAGVRIPIASSSNVLGVKTKDISPKQMYKLRDSLSDALQYYEDNTQHENDCSHKWFASVETETNNLIPVREYTLHYTRQQGKLGTITVKHQGEIKAIMLDSFCNKQCYLKLNFEKWYNWFRNEYQLTYKNDPWVKLNDESLDLATRLYNIPPYFVPESFEKHQQVGRELEEVSKMSWMEYAQQSLPHVLTSFKWAGAFVGIMVLIKKMGIAIGGDTQGGGVYEYSRPKGMASVSKIKYLRPRVQKQRSNTGFQPPTAFESAKNKVVKNMTEICVRDEDDNKMLRKMYGVGLVAHFMIMPKHCYEYIKKYSPTSVITVKLVNEDHNYVYKFSEADFILSGTSDLCVFRVPSGMHMFKDIRSCFILDDRLKKVFPSEAFLVLVPGLGRPTPSVQKVKLGSLESSVDTYDVATDTDATIVDLIHYNYSESGACGSFLIIDEQRSIVGMHVAGEGDLTAGDGFSSLLTEELINELLPEDKNVCLKLEREDFELCEPLEQANLQLQTQMDVEPLYSVPQDMKPRMPGVSKIKPSRIQGVVSDLKPTRFPAFLGRHEKDYPHEVTPLMAGIECHGKPVQDFATHLVEEAANFIENKYFRYRTPRVNVAKKLTIEEAIAGIPGIEGYEPLDLKTSVGWPWTTTNKNRKDQFMEFLRDEQEQPIGLEYIDERIVDRVTENSKKRSEGKVPPVIFVDTLKDEKRKPEKRMQYGGTRVFCASPIDYTIELRQNFGHFMAMFRTSRFVTPHAIGVAPDGPEWGQLASKLRKVNPKGVFTFDYSNFGASINSKVLRSVVGILVRWTMANVIGVDETELWSLMENLVRSDHIVQNLVYRQKSGAPSGSALTDIINSMVNMVYMAIAWLGLTGLSFEEYVENVYYCTYGDDGIGSVSEKYKDKFNAKTISKFFSQYGIVGTDATKGAEITPYGTLYESSFLKRGFKIHPLNSHYYLAPIDFSVVEDTPMWIWKSVNDDIATRENVIQALQLCYGHGEEVFTKFRDKLNVALSKVEIEVVTTSWQELDRVFFPELYV